MSESMDNYEMLTKQPILPPNVGGYVWCGTLRDGSRFRRTSSNLHYMLGINVYRGNLYEVNQVTGKRKRIRSVWN